MSNEIYVYARNSATGEISIDLKASLNRDLYEELCEVPIYEIYESLNELIDENNRLDIENEHLEERIEQAEARYDEKVEEFWRWFATQVNTLGHDPLSLIADELKKYELYLDRGIAA